MTIYYVYAYINKKTGLPYYIGKGKGNRVYAKHNGITVPKDRSKIVFLETNLSEIGAFALERRYILWYGRKDLDTGILLNRTEGGEGRSGSILSENHKQALHDGRRKTKNTEEHKQALAKGKASYKYTKEVKKKMSEAKQKMTKDHRKSVSSEAGKASQAKRQESGYYQSEEWKLCLKRGWEKRRLNASLSVTGG